MVASLLVDKLTFWAECVKALAWPLVVLLLGAPALWVLRGLVNGLKLKRVKQGDWEAEFDSAAADLLKALPKPRAKRRVTIGGAGSVGAPFDVSVDGSPTGAVLAAWANIERDLHALAEREGVDPNQSFATTLTALTSKGVISSDDANSIMGLRQLRNLAVHGPNGEVPVHRAQEFVAMAEAIRWVLSGKPPQSGSVG